MPGSICIASSNLLNVLNKIFFLNYLFFNSFYQKIKIYSAENFGFTKYFNVSISQHSSRNDFKKSLISLVILSGPFRFNLFNFRNEFEKSEPVSYIVCKKSSIKLLQIINLTN
jgi:hypothetical protein